MVLCKPSDGTRPAMNEAAVADLQTRVRERGMVYLVLCWKQVRVSRYVVVSSRLVLCDLTHLPLSVVATDLVWSI
jgi:hypothetical protein